MDSRVNEERTLAEVFPTIEVAKEYLRHMHTASWGQMYLLKEPTSFEAAAEFITRVVDAVNAIRNLALTHQQGLTRAAELYEQLEFPVNTKHLMEND